MALLMALTMILAMGTTAFADEGTTSTGTLTINNTVEGKTLDLYQIFSATKSGTNVAYTLNTAYEGFFQTKIGGASELTGEALSEKAYEYVSTQVGQDGSTGAALAKELLSWIEQNASNENVKETHTTVTTTAGTTTISKLAYGYYVVYPLGATDTSSAPGDQKYQSVASLVSVTSTDVSVNMKSNYPTVEKKVNGKNADDVNIGDTVTYTLTSKVPDMTGYKSYVFNFKDTLSEGLTFDKITSVKVDETEITEAQGGNVANDTYTLAKDGQNITITMNNFLASNKDRVGQTITVTYTATLNAKAKTGFDPNTNSATVEYSNNPAKDEKGESETSVVDVHTFDFTIFKYHLDGQEKSGLSGAEFELYKANGEAKGEKINLVSENGVYRKATAAEASATGFKSATIVSGTDGKVKVTGLDAGTYYLEETKAPEGYNKLTGDIKVEIKASYDETTGKLTNYSVDYTYNGNTTTGTAITSKDNSPEVAVENKTGAELPSTGSKGALMVTIAGIALLAVMAASSIYSKKRKAEK